MTTWERTFLKLLLRTTAYETELPLAKLLRELETERPHIRSYWKQENRIVLTHLMISSMRMRSCPHTLIQGRWYTLIDYIDPPWRLFAPGVLRRAPVLETFLEFKRAYDCSVNTH